MNDFNFSSPPQIVFWRPRDYYSYAFINSRVWCYRAIFLIIWYFRCGPRVLIASTVDWVADRSKSTCLLWLWVNTYARLKVINRFRFTLLKCSVDKEIVSSFVVKKIMFSFIGGWIKCINTNFTWCLAFLGTAIK